MTNIHEITFPIRYIHNVLMQGPAKNPGINQRALKLLFEDTAARSDYSFTITVSVMEIYNEMLR